MLDNDNLVNIFNLGNNKVRIYSVQTGDPLHIIGMKGSENGQFLQPIAVCFQKMALGSGGLTKVNEPAKDDNIKTTSLPILVVGDSNNRIQVNKALLANTPCHIGSGIYMSIS